ncbi:hypothetical protein J7643_13290 [bacterium]|nr:hypothetical protein [bacterium]
MQKFTVAIAVLMMSALVGCGTAPVAAPTNASSNTATAASATSTLVVTSATGTADDAGTTVIKGRNAKGDFHLVLVMNPNPHRYVPDFGSATLNGKAVTTAAQMKALAEELSAAEEKQTDRRIAWSVGMAAFALRLEVNRLTR